MCAFVLSRPVLTRRVKTTPPHPPNPQRTVVPAAVRCCPRSRGGHAAGCGFAVGRLCMVPLAQVLQHVASLRARVRRMHQHQGSSRGACVATAPCMDRAISCTHLLWESMAPQRRLSCAPEGFLRIQERISNCATVSLSGCGVPGEHKH